MSSARWILALFVALLLGSGCLVVAGETDGFAPADPGGLEIDIAIALDTSGSMEGLIDTTRLRLWDIVNDLAFAEPPPRLRVALLSYGNDAYSPATGWVRLETPLTKDLDLVSGRLFELKAKGGNEYVARVLQAAVEGLAWSESDDALRFLFVAGNESTTQDPKIDLGDVAEAALRQDIRLSAIFCGAEGQAVAEEWKELARLAAGRFATIDQSAGTAAKSTPFDEELAKLGEQINETFVPIGEQAQERIEAVASQDANARGLSPSAAASRAATKASPLYAAGWDLVDAVEAGAVDVYLVNEAELPEALRPMTPRDRENYLEDLRFRRAELRRQIVELDGKRRLHLVRESKPRNQAEPAPSFDKVVRQAVRETLQERGVATEGR